MSAKTLIWIGMIVGGFVGGYIPVMFGADALSLWAILGNAVGGIAGIWAGFKLSRSIS